MFAFAVTLCLMVSQGGQVIPDCRSFTNIRTEDCVATLRFFRLHAPPGNKVTSVTCVKLEDRPAGIQSLFTEL